MGLIAKNVMTKNFVSVRPDASIDEVLELLLRHQISGLPVVDADGQLKGVITELDVLKLMFVPGCSDKVSEYSTSEVTTVAEDEPLHDVAELFMSHPVRRLPVVRDGRVLGIISRRDLVRFIHLARTRVAHELETVRATATE